MRFSKPFGILLFSILLVGVGLTYSFVYDNAEEEIMLAEVMEDSLTLNAREGLVYYHNKPFSGLASSFYPNGVQSSSVSYLKGKKHGPRIRWFSDGVRSEEISYVHGKRHGKSTSWWKNGRLRSESNFGEGIADGEQIQWYRSGNIFKKRHLKGGKEEGMQQSWRENGTLYANYEARNGRIFGLKRANLCYELDEEEVQYKD